MAPRRARPLVSPRRASPAGLPSYLSTLSTPSCSPDSRLPPASPSNSVRTLAASTVPPPQRTPPSLHKFLVFAPSPPRSFWTWSRFAGKILRGQTPAAHHAFQYSCLKPIPSQEAAQTQRTLNGNRSRHLYECINTSQTSCITML